MANINPLIPFDRGGDTRQNYLNLNLNKFSKFSSYADCVKSFSTVKAKSQPSYDHNIQNYQVSNFKSTCILYDKKDQENKKKWKKRDRNSSANNSTLSLHIAAYENDIEQCGYESTAKLSDENCKKFTRSFKYDIPHKNEITSLYEFPRQQENEPPNPLIMQYKSRQHLLNPNESVVDIRKHEKISEYMIKQRREKLEEERSKKRREEVNIRNQQLELERKAKEEEENEKAIEDGILVEYGNSCVGSINNENYQRILNSKKRSFPSENGDTNVPMNNDNHLRIKNSKRSNIGDTDQGRCLFCHRWFYGNNMMDHLRRRCKNFLRHFSKYKISDECVRFLVDFINGHIKLPTQEHVLKLIEEALTAIKFEQTEEKNDVYVIGFTEPKKAEYFFRNRAIGVDIYNATTVFKYNIWKKKQTCENNEISDAIDSNNANNWEQIYADYVKALNEINDMKLRQLIEDAYSIAYIGKSVSALRRVKLHFRHGLRCVLLKYVTPINAIVASAVAEEFDRSTNSTLKEMAAEGVLKKPLYKRVILTQIPAEYATFAEYCLTSVCHPVLTGAQLLEGHKRYKYIPIETIYFIGAMILLMVVTSERDCVTPWEYYTTLGQPMGSETQHMSTDLIASGLDASMDELISLTNFTCLTEIRNLFQKGALLYDMRMLKQQIYLAESDEQKRFRPVVCNESCKNIIANLENDETSMDKTFDHDFDAFETSMNNFANENSKSDEIADEFNPFETDDSGNHVYKWNVDSTSDFSPINHNQNDYGICTKFPSFITTYMPVVGHLGDKTWNRQNFIEIFGALLYYNRGKQRNEYLCPFCIYRNTEKELYKHLKSRHSQGPLNVTHTCETCYAPYMANSATYHEQNCFGKDFTLTLEEICTRIDDDTITEYFKDNEIE